MWIGRSWQRTLVVGGAALGLAQGAPAVTIHSESVNGDLSGNRLAPTQLALSVGTNTIVGSTVGGSPDFFSITVPADASFTQLILASFTSSDDLAFLAIESGPIITNTGSVTAMLGWMHPSAVFVGTDVLDNLALGANALGFSPPLGPGTYAMWMQQAQAQPVGYRFDLVVVPEPSAAALLGLGLTALALARRPR